MVERIALQLLDLLEGMMVLQPKTAARGVLYQLSRAACLRLAASEDPNRGSVELEIFSEGEKGSLVVESRSLQRCRLLQLPSSVAARPDYHQIRLAWTRPRYPSQYQDSALAVQKESEERRQVRWAVVSWPVPSAALSVNLGRRQTVLSSAKVHS